MTVGLVCTIFAKNWLQIKKFLYFQPKRPVQHEVLSSYLSGLLVLAGLFLSPYLCTVPMDSFVYSAISLIGKWRIRTKLTPSIRF